MKLSLTAIYSNTFGRGYNCTMPSQNLIYPKSNMGPLVVTYFHALYNKAVTLLGFRLYGIQPVLHYLLLARVIYEAQEIVLKSTEFRKKIYLFLS